MEGQWHCCILLPASGSLQFHLETSGGPVEASPGNVVAGDLAH